MNPTAYRDTRFLHPGRVAGERPKPQQRDIVTRHVLGTQLTVLTELIDGPRTTLRLMEAVYRHGGLEPKNGAATVYNAIFLLRNKLRPEWKIEREPDPNYPGHGWYWRYALRRAGR